MTKAKIDKLVDEQPLDAELDEARMSAVARRLLNTPPDRQAVGRTIAPKRQAKRQN